MASNTNTGLRKTSVKEHSTYIGKSKQSILKRLINNNPDSYIVKYEKIGSIYVLYVNY
jgi:hypothetical protein